MLNQIQKIMALKLKELKIPIFNYTVLFISGDIDEAVGYLEDVENVVLQYDNSCLACTWSYRGKSAIWFDEDTITLPVMTHELIHVTYAMAERLGIEFGDQEVFCYTVEFLLEEVLKYIKFN